MWRCIAAAVLLLFAAPAQAAIEIIGSHGYTYNVTAGTVTFNIDAIQNTGTSTVGHIRVELWFAATPYAGSSITGWGWSGCTSTTGNNGSICSVVISGSQSVTATFSN